MVEKISTVNMTHEQWLDIRSRSIGGSDAAAIVGLSSYESPYSVWAEKTGKTLPPSDNEAMRQGRDLEQYVSERFSEKTGKKVRRVNAIIKNPTYPFAHANIDRDIVGENAGLECKTTSVLALKRFKNGEYPANYYVQCMHYMAITGAEKWYLAVLVLGREFMVFEIPRDEDEINALMAAESSFWTNVETDTPPVVDGSKATTEAIKETFSDVEEGAAVDLFDCAAVITQYFDAKERQKVIEAELGECENKIKAALGSAEYGISDLAKISWKSQERRTIDKTLLLKTYPEVDISSISKTSQSRVLRISKLKEA